MDGGGAEQRLNEHIAREMPALAAARCVLAVSGGADSTAMAHVLASDAGALHDAARAGRVVVAHFDHRLRGDEASVQDRANVEALCARLRLRAEHGAWDAPRTGEAAARAARYAFLGAVAQEAGAAFVVTGHTADDQAETVLMHAARGAGLHGLAGMRPLAPLAGAPGVRIARPLLCIDRAETRAWCASHGLAFNDDVTNDDRASLRSRVRNDWLPAVEAASPGARDTLLRLAAAARAALHALEPAAAAAIIDAGAAHVTLSRAALREFGDEVAHCAWRDALTRLLGDAREFDRRHYALLAAAAHAHAGTTLTLPRGIVATVDARVVTLSRGALHEPAIDASFSAALPFAGELGAWRLEVAPAGEGDAIVVPRDSVVRGRRAGDRIRPRGLSGTKKLQDFYVDRKVPRRARDAAPVIASGAQVHWTPFGAGEEMRDGAAYVIRAARTAAVA